MDVFVERKSIREGVYCFIWQHFLLLVSLFVMTLGVVLCVRSGLGSSVISSAPLAMTLAGENGMAYPLSLGDYTNLLNALLVAGQVVVLRRRFEIVQLLQLVIGCVFGILIDLNMYLTSSFVCDTVAYRAIAQLAGCTVLGLGIAMEIRCGSITMPGEGLPVAISKVMGVPFAKAKICVDIILVVLAVSLCYLYFHEWLWNVVGFGTLFAMLYVGIVVKRLDPYMGWFGSLLGNRPGLHRVVYGLARYIKSKGSGNS
ncbi:MAG: hypothetical protein K2J49_04465 [Muribaculaceae bacterium]|nr:hypothetical protein [Muribaculaceae bacterium]